jgi:hypothetical protein
LADIFSWFSIDAMKMTAAIWGTAVLFAASAVSVSAQQTAFAAWDVLSRDRGAAVGGEVVLVSGEKGSEQPEVWRMVARDPAFAGRFREYGVRRGRVVSEAAVPAAQTVGLSGSPLNRGRIKIDSHVVFWRAYSEGKKALIGFDSVDYELRNAEFSTKPVWVVRLLKNGGIRVGELAISAESGQVLRRTWFEAGRQTASGPGATSTSNRGSATTTTTKAPAATAVSATAQQAWEGTRTGWNQGTRAVKSGFSKASTTVGGWLMRAGAAAAPDPVPAAPKSGQPAAPKAAPKKATAPPPASGNGPANWEHGRYDSSSSR